jgi:endonuclease/exonuclease/phosphatase family metal-dependent hydrolase
LICKISLPASKDSKDSKDKYFYAACSHLNLLHTGRLLQYQQIKKHILLKNENNEIPFVLAGDFNDWNKKSDHVFEVDLGMKEVHKTIHGKFAKTFPAIYPLLCLDRIYVKNLKIKTSIIMETKNKHNLLSHLSDHLPLYCEVEI